MTPSTAIGIAIAVIVLASVVPTAFDSFYAADTANWTIDGEEDSKTVDLWYLIPLLIVVAVLLAFYARGRD